MNFRDFPDTELTISYLDSSLDAQAGIFDMFSPGMQMKMVTFDDVILQDDLIAMGREGRRKQLLPYGIHCCSCALDKSMIKLGVTCLHFARQDLQVIYASRDFDPKCEREVTGHVPRDNVWVQRQENDVQSHAAEELWCFFMLFFCLVNHILLYL